MKRKRRGRTHKRRAQAKRGRRLVIGALTASVLYFGILFATTVMGGRWGNGSASDQMVASLAAGTVFLVAISLAFFAFLGHPILRPLYLILNFLAAVAGTLWVGFQLAWGAGLDGALFDVAGIGIAIFVCWVFIGARTGRAFFEEQEFTVKRK